MTTANTHTSPSRPNFFILLGLNPNAAWDQVIFEKTLREKRNEWSRQQAGVAKKALAAKQKLELISQINAVMMDEKLREAEAAAARVILAAERKAREDEFQKQLAFINAKDSIEQAELDKFIDDFQDIYPADKIKNLVKVKIVPTGSSVSRDEQQLDPTMMKNIADRLDIIKKLSLYEVLELSDATATPELCRAAEELYKDMVHRMPKTAEVTAKTELAGLAKNIFQSEDMRKKYDESLRRSSLDRLLADLDVAMDRTVNKDVQEGQVSLFLENAQRVGWKREEAYERLKEHARLRKWFLEPRTTEGKVRCRNCNALNERNSKVCTNCGLPLSIECPNCGEPVDSEDRICGNCGFGVGNRHLVDNGLKEIDRLFKAGDLAKALEVLRKIEQAWRPKNSDERLARIKQYRVQLEQQEQQKRQVQQEKEKQLRSLISQKRFFAAREFLETQGVDIPDRDSQRRTIESTILQAQDLVNRVRRNPRAVNNDDTIASYQQMKAFCQDIPGIEDLQKPPAPPHNLQAKVKGSVVGLSWTPSTTQNVFYTIVRKSISQPNAFTDGKVLGKVMGCTYDDTAPLAGLPVYYAIYSGYDEVRSTQAALLVQPILLTQEVLSISVQINDGQVDLAWAPPQNVYSVVVVRKEQTPPTAINDGVRVGDYRPGQKRLTDRNVQNRRMYYYTFFCQFKDHDGRLVSSPGEYISATPDTPPLPINHLDIKSTKLDQGYEVVISWQRPDKGDVIIMKTDKPFSLPSGKVLPEVELSNYGERLDPIQDTVIQKWTKAGMVYYTPVIIFQMMAYIGASQSFVCVDNISNLRYQNIGTAIRFHWKWPENCQEVIISYSTDGWPQPNDPSVTTRRVNFAAYDHLGQFDLRGVVDQDYYIIIAAVIDQAGTKIIAEGIRIYTRQATQMVLTYEIRNPTMLHRKRTLRIRAHAPGTLPALLLVGRRDRLPFNKTDGDLLQRIGPTIIGGKEVVIELSERVYPPRTFGRLFLEEDNMHALVIVKHPEDNMLRLS